MQGATTTSMLFIGQCPERVPTRQMAPCRRNPKGAGVFGPQALSFVGHEDYASFRSSFRACDPNTPARDPTDFHHGLLGPLLLYEGARFRAAWVIFSPIIAIFWSCRRFSLNQ